MTRLRADLLLLLVAIIWGAAFVAQKSAFDHVGAFTFVAARFAISAILVLPLALRDYKRQHVKVSGGLMPEIFQLCAAFSVGVILQQMGIGHTTVTNAGFLTGLYVVFVPVICWAVYRQKPTPWIWPAALLSIAGVWLLSGMATQTEISFNKGDILVLLCAAGFAWQIALIERILKRSPAPFFFCCLQYAVCAAIALVIAITIEQPTWEGLMGAMWPILYAGVISGGIAYTLQAVAQQYTPPSDSAVIMSGESLFAALAGALFLGDRLTGLGWTGCALIMFAIILVEFGPKWFLHRKRI